MYNPGPSGSSGNLLPGEILPSEFTRPNFYTYISTVCHVINTLKTVQRMNILTTYLELFYPSLGLLDKTANSLKAVMFCTSVRPPPPGR